MCHGSHIYIPILYLVKTLYAKKIEFIYNIHNYPLISINLETALYTYTKSKMQKKKDFIEEACYYKFSVIIFCLKMTSKRSSYMEIPNLSYPFFTLRIF